VTTARWILLMLAIWAALYYSFPITLSRKHFGSGNSSFSRMLIDDRKLSARRGLLGGSEDESRRKEGNVDASPATLDRRRLVLVAGSFLVATFAPVLSAAAATLITLEVGATGGLPGFHSGELRRYLALHMAGSRLGDWRFEPAADDASAPNRVIWYAGGEVRSFGRRDMAERRSASTVPSRSRRGST
jgi:hypothetical protein